MRLRAWLVFLPVLFSASVYISPSQVALAGDETAESRIKHIVTDEIRAGILQKSPDLYLKSYLPTATVFSFRLGPVDTAGYRKVLADYFAIANPESVDCEISDLRVEGDRASVTVRFSEKGKNPDGSEYGEVFKRYLRLVRAGGAWQVESDGYNESHRRIERMHNKPMGGV